MTSNRKSAIRGRLLGGASGLALVAVSALTLGVNLPGSARAGTVNPVQGSTYSLSSGNNPITFGSATNVQSYGDAVDGDTSTHWTVTNQGTLAGYDSGVKLLSQSTLTNSGTITASPAGYLGVGANLVGGGALINQSGGYIGGNGGVVMSNDGTITNAGTIIGSSLNGVQAVGGAVSNQAGGTISGHLSGVYFNGANGSVTNAGSIDGDVGGVVLTGGGVVSNQGGGIITGTQTAVYLKSGGSIDNQGLISGGSIAAVYVTGGAGTITNSNQISNSAGDGVFLKSGGSVSNIGEGSITGYQTGIRVTGAAGTVINSGYIGSSVSLSGRNGAGVALFAGGSVTNNETGVIHSGGAGVYSAAGATTVTNHGSITGGYGGVYAKSGTLTVNNSGMISGTNGGIYAKGGAANITNSGTISAAQFEAIALNLGGTVDNSGVISGQKAGIYAGAAASITNSGTISGQTQASAGVALYTGGAVSNTGNIFGGAAGVYGKGAATTVTNSGVIAALGEGGGIAGVGLAGGGTVINQTGGAIDANTGVIIVGHGSVTNQNTAIIIGYQAGVYQFGGAGTVTNSGLIQATGDNTNATPSEGEYAGVNFHNGGTVSNLAGGTIAGYDAGVAIHGAAGTVTNSGVIGGAIEQPQGSPVHISGTPPSVVSKTGVYLAAGGVVTNNAGGLISGSIIGVAVYGGGVVTNAGTITASGLAAPVGTGVHTSAVAYGRAGVFMYSANGANTVTNQAGGLISAGYAGVVAYGGGTVTNAGTIVATAHYVGVNGSAGHIVTDCSRLGCGLASYGVGVAVLSGPHSLAVVDNQAGGTISGTYTGVAVYGGGSVANAGTIITTGYGPRPQGGAVHTINGIFGAYEGAGVAMFSNGTVTNSLSNVAGGLISGSYLGAVIYGGGTVTNAGTIIARGVGEIAGGTGVHTSAPIFPSIGLGMIGSASAPNNIYNQTTGLISGSFFGALIEGGGTVTNAGTIIGTGAEFAGPTGVHAAAASSESVGLLVLDVTEGVGGVATQTVPTPVPVHVNNLAGGTITGQTFGVIVEGYYGAVTGASSTVTNAGVITATSAAIAPFGSAVHVASGSTYASGIGVAMLSGGTVENLAGGTISGAGQAGVYVVRGPGFVTNAGQISADVGIGVSLKTSGTVTNQAGGTISGYIHGVNIGGGLAGVVNAGLITGVKNSAVGIHNGGYVTNQATGVISGAKNGVYATGGLDTVTNSGSISGAAVTGVAMQTGGVVNNLSGGSISGGVIGVYTAGAATSITNAGAISGGIQSIAFTGGGANTLTLQTGSTLTGDAVGSKAEGAINALVLQGSGTANNNFVGFNTLDVTADGVWILNGTSTIGATTIDSGNLRVGDAEHSDAALNSPITINAGGTLSGHGSVGSVTNNGGTLSPGGSIGTLTINGDLTQSSTSTLSLELNPTISSNLVVSGSATLAGGLQLVADPGIYRKGTTYTFLTAGSISGSFSSLSSNNGLLLQDINSTTTGVLTLLNGTFSSVGATNNQTAVGQAIADIPVGVANFDTVVDAAIGLTPGAQQNAALDALGGEIDADFVTVGRDSARAFLGGISDQLSATGAARGDGGDDKDPWVRAYGNLGNLDGNGNAHGFVSTSGGAMIGFSRGWRGATVGAALSYGHTDLSLRGLDQKGQFDTGAIALYGEQREGVLFFDAAGSIAYDHGYSARTIIFPGIARRTTGTFDGFTGAASLTAGARLAMRNDLLVEPSVSVTYSHVSQDGFIENGGVGADLTIGSKKQDALESLVQAKVSKPFTLSNGNVLRADFKLGWDHEWTPTGTSISEAFFAAGAVPFTVAGATPDHDRGVVGAGLAYDASKRMTWYGRYEATLSQRQNDNAVTAGFKFVW